ncbi:50S ribosomal protein L25 [Candidatus Fukatsuia symbiotica]|uniref:Large ribosomal subunit protein bL25 n=1 Tax=Candidatus Fukatsuia symbiotica TaxID=1878942 RepID=A0A2U8I803_9GAMM|nr:50S ribosomal protein L25 [Candidatus Fukatsuia symbiotica]AWK15188.1 50S ribosomal protein L25 [Candidatus Fukatsuia symbiotica]MEA9444020.1 50S ribosomal protein L25 [Candidatus Fukatsuia symbiotica]
MIIINADVRNVKGKGASRRLRAENKFPAIIYGDSKQPISITLDHDSTKHAELKPGFYGETLVLAIDGEEIEVQVQAVQRHPFKPKLTHIDFVRVPAKSLTS